MRGGFAGYPPDACVLIGVLVVLLVVFQQATLVKFSVLPAGAGLVDLRTFAHQVAAAVEFTAVDLVLACGILIVCELIVATELWFRSITRLLDRVFATERGTLFLFTVICLTLVRFYFAPGQLSWAGDASEHIIYAKIAAASIAAGEIPVWTNVFCAGSPYLQFYGFFFFYMVGLFELVTGDFFNALKAVTGLSHGLSGIGLYFLVRAATGSRAAGFIAGIGYVGSLWHTQQVMIMGRLPLSIFYLVLPLPFYACERLIGGQSVARPVVGGALSLGVLAFVHPGYALWSMIFFVIYGAVRIGVTRGLNDYKLLIALSGMLCGGGAFGAFLTVPMWVERAHTGLREGVGLGGVLDPNWENVFVWSNGYFRLSPIAPEAHHWYGGYIGFSLVIVALIGGIRAAMVRDGIGRSRVGLAIALALGVACLLVFGHKWPVMADAAIVQAFNAGRYLLFLLFFLAMGVGVAAGGFYRMKRTRVYTALLLLVLADVGTTSFRQLYIPRWAQPLDYPKELIRTIQEEHAPLVWPELPAYRLFATSKQAHDPLLVSWLYAKTGIPELQGLYNEAPLAHQDFMAPWAKLVQREPISVAMAELQDELLLAGARLFNVRELLVEREGVEMVARMRPRAVGPVFTASEIVPYPEQDIAHDLEQGLVGEYRAMMSATERPEDLQREFAVYWTIAMMELAPQGNVCKRIFVRGGEAVSLADNNPRVEVLEHTVRNQRVDLLIRAAVPCFIRLAYSYYPFLVVSVDGEEIQALETAGHFIALPVEAGEHRIVLEARLSPLRKGLLSLSACVLVLGLGWWYAASRRGRRSGPSGTATRWN